MNFYCSDGHVLTLLGNVRETTIRQHRHTSFMITLHCYQMQDYSGPFNTQMKRQRTRICWNKSNCAYGFIVSVWLVLSNVPWSLPRTIWPSVDAKKATFARWCLKAQKHHFKLAWSKKPVDIVELIYGLKLCLKHRQSARLYIS